MKLITDHHTRFAKIENKWHYLCYYLILIVGLPLKRILEQFLV